MLFVLRQIERERPAVVLARAQIQGACARFLAELASMVANAQRQAAAKVQKMGRDDEDPATRAVEDAAWEALRDEVRPHLEAVAKDGAAQALTQVNVEATLAAALDQVNAAAVSWAELRAGELITSISETTRERIRELVKAGLEAGRSNDEIADELQESAWFSSSRAETVARTETAFADVQGNVIGWKASGVVAAREWKTDVDPCPRCAELDGEVVGLEGSFPEGDPPLHPNCECVLLPVLVDEEES